MFTIPNLGLNTIHGTLCIVIFAVIFTLITYLNNDLSNPLCKEINEAEYKLITKEYITLYLHRFLHFSSTFSVLLLPYVFKPNFILYLMFVVYVFVAVIYWNLVGECPFSINEKQLLNKKYVNGKTKIEPYLTLAIPDNLIFIFHYTYRVNLAIILFRLYKHFYLSKSQIPEAIRM